jgi:predicted nucleotidyltransferase component of viral defense system
MLKNNSYNHRFSEDIDFDNFKLTQDNFQAVTKHLQRGLEEKGFVIEMRNVTRGAYHCYIRFPEILQKENLTGHNTEKILLRLASESHEFDYEPEKPFLNKVGVFTQIRSTPRELLLSQKFYAVLNRMTNKGRDFYDIVFLLGQSITPDYEYLDLKLGLRTAEDLKRKILDRCSRISMEKMAQDVGPFLFNPEDIKKVTSFPEYLKNAQI